MRKKMEGGLDRYLKLGLEDSLTLIRHYPSSCTELALIIKLSFSKFPKFLQSQIFQDLLTAFRLLPRMQTQTCVLAANILLQSAESALPKQKKAQSVTEFKHAIIAHKRYSKALDIHKGKETIGEAFLPKFHVREGCTQSFYQHFLYNATGQDPEYFKGLVYNAEKRLAFKHLVELPQDILVHVFSFLDLQSLLSASQVSRSWNAASSDGHLWQLMYTMYINTTHNFSKTIKLNGELTVDEISQRVQESTVCDSSLDWKSIFKKAYNDFSLKKLFTSSRGFCKHCYAIVWVSDMDFETNSKLKCKYHHIKPISTRQIVEYIDGNYTSFDSDSDSDSDDESVSKLWAYPKRKGFSL